MASVTEVRLYLKGALCFGIRGDRPLEVSHRLRRAPRTRPAAPEWEATEAIPATLSPAAPLRARDVRWYLRPPWDSRGSPLRFLLSPRDSPTSLPPAPFIYPLGVPGHSSRPLL